MRKSLLEDVGRRNVGHARLNSVSIIAVFCNRSISVVGFQILELRKFKKRSLIKKYASLVVEK